MDFSNRLSDTDYEYIYKKFKIKKDTLIDIVNLKLGIDINNQIRQILKLYKNEPLIYIDYFKDI